MSDKAKRDIRKEAAPTSRRSRYEVALSRNAGRFEARARQAVHGRSAEPHLDGCAIGALQMQDLARLIGRCDLEAEAFDDLAGGAQFGKSIWELNLGAYLTGQRFRNFGLYLPDDDLVEGIVDSKFRPDVVDQIDWFAQMTQVGKALNKSGKAVNRKGAFLVTDGDRIAARGGLNLHGSLIRLKQWKIYGK